MNNTSPSFIGIRGVTPDSLAEDLDAQRLVLHPDVVIGLSDQLKTGVVSFFIAESAYGKPYGQAGVRWDGPSYTVVRQALDLKAHETVPNIAFVSVPERHRRQGMASLLLATIYGEALTRGYRRVFLTVAVGNMAARSLYDREGFVTTGHIRSSKQYDRLADGTYGEPIMDEMELFTKDLM